MFLRETTVEGDGMDDDEVEAEGDEAEEEEAEGTVSSSEEQLFPGVETLGAQPFGTEATIVREVSGGEEKKPAKMDPKRVIEAALFMSSKPLNAQELGKFAGIAAPGYIEQLVKQLAQEYEHSGSAVKIVFESEGWIMRLRDEYAQKVAPLAQEAELSKGALKILAYISQNEGIEQSKVANRLGSTVYGYVHELVEKGFISKEKKGRTSVLRTTQKFRDYFSC